MREAYQQLVLQYGIRYAGQLVRFGAAAGAGRGRPMNATETRLLTIPQWRELAQNGTVLPMRIPLDGDSMRPLIRRGRDMVTFVPLTRPLQREMWCSLNTLPGDMWRIAYSAYRLNR